LSIDWHNRNFRELFEIKQFIYHYETLHRRTLEVVEKREKPDYIVKDTLTGELLGIELTSVYLDNRSVPELHMKEKGVEYVPFDQDKIDLYEMRIIESISTKIHKAQSGYDTRTPLLLSIYVNEYIAVYMDEFYWRDFVNSNISIFNGLSPFCEIIFWPLPGSIALSVTNSKTLLFK
jgi:hypothetical protein